MQRNGLTPGQSRVFDLLLEGLAEKEIAHRLRRTSNTVHTHVKAIYRVFGVSSRPELLASHIRRHTTAKAKLGRSKRKSPV
jgi:DNA-binding NarL/FixJ family response regulator